MANPLSHPGLGINTPDPAILGKGKIWGSFSTQIPNLTTDWSNLGALNFGLAYGLMGYAQVGLTAMSNGLTGTLWAGEFQVNPFPKGLTKIGGLDAAVGLRNISDKKQMGLLDAPFQSSPAEALGDISGNSGYLVLGKRVGMLLQFNLGWGSNEFTGHGRLNKNLHGLFGMGRLKVGPASLIGEIDGRALNLGASASVHGLSLKGAWMGVENTMLKESRRIGLRSSIGIQLSYTL